MLIGQLHTAFGNWYKAGACMDKTFTNEIDITQAAFSDGPNSGPYGMLLGKV